MLILVGSCLYYFGLGLLILSFLHPEIGFFSSLGILLLGKIISHIGLFQFTKKRRNKKV